MSDLRTDFVDLENFHTLNHNETNEQVNINSRPATNYTVTHSASGILTLDALNGHSQTVTVEADITDFSVTNLPDGLPFLLILVGDGVSEHEGDFSSIELDDANTLSDTMSIKPTARLHICFVQHTIAAVKHWWAAGGVINYSGTESVVPSGLSLVGVAELNYTGSWSSTHSIPLPTGIVEGDLIEILVSTQMDPVRPNPSTPSGFTQRWDAGGDVGYRPRVAKFYKIATGGESGSVAVSWSESLRAHGCSMVFRGVDNATPYDVAAPTEFVGSGNPNPPGGTTVTDNCWAIAYCVGNLSGGTPSTISSGYTLLVDQDADDRSFVNCYFAMGVAGAEDPGAYTWNTDNSTAMTDFLRPA